MGALKYCYRGDSVYHGGRRRTFAMSWVFCCPSCEYFMTAASQEGIETIRSLHLARCRPDLLVQMRFEDTFGVAVT